MCRRCGESDKRGPAKARRVRRKWLLSTPEFGGDGVRVQCALHLSESCKGVVDNATMQVDRIIPGCYGGGYARWNIRPSCRPCNIARIGDYEPDLLGDECRHG